jgi:hypothetical protein
VSIPFHCSSFTFWSSSTTSNSESFSVPSTNLFVWSLSTSPSSRIAWIQG